MTFDTLHDKLLAGAASGEVPAVSQGADQWVGEFAYLDALMPLDDLISEYGFKEEDFADNAWEHFRYLDGHIYAAPFYLENRVLYYRTDILEEAGFDGPPETWDEVFEYAKVLSNGEDKFTMGHQDGWLDFHFFSCLLYSYGGDFYNKERTECILNNEQGLKALKYYEALYDQNVIPKDADKRVEAFKGFKEGYYAMVESGNWWIGLIENQAPELEGKWAMAYLPTGDKYGTLLFVTTKNMLVSFLTMKAGSVFNLHTHPQEQFMIVIEGFCDEVIGDKIYRVEAGEVIHLPAGIPHGAFLRDIDCKAIDIFVPSREDYVQSFRKQNPHASLSFTD